MMSIVKNHYQASYHTQLLDAAKNIMRKLKHSFLQISSVELPKATEIEEWKTANKTMPPDYNIVVWDYLLSCLGSCVSCKCITDYCDMLNMGNQYPFFRGLVQYLIVLSCYIHQYAWEH